MYIAHILKKEVTGSPSELCKLERKSFFTKICFSGGRDLEKNLPGRCIGNKGIFHIGLNMRIGTYLDQTKAIKW